jgi:Gram-negative bacterial TonB protein C-terminal
MAYWYPTCFPLIQQSSVSTVQCKNGVESQPRNEASTRMSVRATECAGKVPSSNLRAPFTERGALRLLVRNDSLFTNWRDSIAALASRTRPRSSPRANYFLRRVDATRAHFDRRPLEASVLLHCSLVALVIYLPLALPAKPSPLLSTPQAAERIYYRARLLHSDDLPRLAPAGPGGRSGSGFRPASAPISGSTSQHPRITIVSKPVHPDNYRQTIYQPISPPELRIPTELKLPNLVSLPHLERPKAPIVPSDAKPILAQRPISAVAAPSIKGRPADPQISLLKTSETQPSRPPFPTSGGGAPILNSREGVAAGSSADAPDLVVVGVDPADATNQLTLAAGNRWGQFTLAPPSGILGSPAGNPNGVVGGGGAKGAMAGDESTGVGAGGSGGGGGIRATSGSVSIAGPNTTGARSGSLDSVLSNEMVYLVSAPVVKVRKNALVVSAGSIGGGTLNVYGALKCGKVYSIFLPMPGKSWSMQYCDKSASTQKTASDGMLRLDTPLLPPDFDMAQRFDFKRIPVPAELSHRSIILKGVISVDGTVQRLVVYQGVIPEMDEAARSAFSRWKFQPAVKDGKPVEVEILVGIPPLAGEDRVNH